MQYLLTEQEYHEFSNRPSTEQHKALADNLRRIAMKAAGIEELGCGKGYCDDCIFSGSYAPHMGGGGSFGYKNICPNPNKRCFSK